MRYKMTKEVKEIEVISQLVDKKLQKIIAKYKQKYMDNISCKSSSELQRLAKKELGIKAEKIVVNPKTNEAIWTIKK